MPVDISGDYLRDSAAEVAARFPALAVEPVVADFARPFDLPASIAGLPKLGFFPGSTIGNFVPRTATDLLRSFRDLLGDGAQLLIGMDRVKPVERLLAAYDDPQGVTAAFNLNLLERINRELDGDIPIDAFRHEARWNDILSRIEMHLVATRDVDFTDRRPRASPSPKARRSTPRTATNTGVAAPACCCLPAAGPRIAEWTDPAGDFAVILAEALPNRFAP